MGKEKKPDWRFLSAGQSQESSSEQGQELHTSNEKSGMTLVKDLKESYLQYVIKISQTMESPDFQEALASAEKAIKTHLNNLQRGLLILASGDNPKIYYHNEKDVEFLRDYVNKYHPKTEYVQFNYVLEGHILFTNMPPSLRDLLAKSIPVQDPERADSNPAAQTTTNEDETPHNEVHGP